jgi:hypothetical protein
MSVDIAARDALTGNDTVLKGMRGAELIAEVTLTATFGGDGQKLALSGASAKSAVINTPYAAVTVDVDCYVRQGDDANNDLAAVADGTDQFLLAGNMYRVGVIPGNKLAFITEGGAGFARITPGA